MKYFTIQELSKSITAQNKRIDNTPGLVETENLIFLVDNVLDPTREKFGKPIIVNSGFRCEKLNKIIGGAKNSQHVTGEAVDIQSIGDVFNKQLFDLIKDNIPFDQLIWEFGNDYQPDWIHVSLKKEGNRHEILKAIKINGKTKYIKFN